jgi:plastocyanin
LSGVKVIDNVFIINLLKLKAMGTNFTSFSLRTLFATFIFAFFSLNLAGQTTHQVAVTDGAFTPKELTIMAGDKVVWTNTGAMEHNVNGTKATFANNPVSFGNSLGLNWTYEFVFNTAGIYNYHCDPHAAFGMTGKVTVNPNTSTESKNLEDIANIIRLYPNPASNYIELKLPVNYEKVGSLKVYSIAGTLIHQKVFSGHAESLRFDLSNFKSGIYFMEINAGSKRDILKFMKQ